MVNFIISVPILATYVHVLDFSGITCMLRVKHDGLQGGVLKVCL